VAETTSSPPQNTQQLRTKASRKDDYRRLDAIGYDMVEARIDRFPTTGETLEQLAREYGVTRFNMTTWIRRCRTTEFIEDHGVEGILEMIADGASLAMIADANSLSNGILEVWARSNIDSGLMNDAREAAAERWFSAAFTEIDNAMDELSIAKVREKAKIQQFVVGNVTRRYSTDKNIRVTANDGVSFSISYGGPAPGNEPGNAKPEGAW